MTYTTHGTITAADYNALAGVTAVSASSSTNATGKVGYLWGVGYGDRGYGQANVSITPATTSSLVSQEWKTLISTAFAIANWQGINTTSIPPVNSYDSKQPIIAYQVGHATYDLVTLLSVLDSSRFSYQSAGTSTTLAATSVQNVAWGAGGASITATFSATFPTEDAARYFFNSGGDIRFKFSHPNTSTAHDVSWNGLLTNAFIAFKAGTTINIYGGAGVGTYIGYHQLTTNWQTVFNGTNTGSGAYASNGYMVEAAAASIAGVNGAKGNVINFRVTLIDMYATSPDIVSAGTNVAVSYLKSTTLTIAAPSIVITSGFNGVNPSSVVSSFTKNTSSGVAPLSIQFTDTSTGNPISWYWDFGDGTSSSLQNPSHTFSTAGTFTVTLTSTNIVSSNSSSQTVTVTPATVLLPVVFGATTANASLNINSLSGYSPGHSNIQITVNSGVYLYATSTGTYGLNITGGQAGDVITMVNNGYIMGQGGNGGGQQTSGGGGGPALNIPLPATINATNGYIGGGGGGGGGSNGGFFGGAGGGGAGGGNGGFTNSNYTTGVGGGPGSAGTSANSSGSPAVGGGAGGGGGCSAINGAGGGRIMPGAGGAGAGNTGGGGGGNGGGANAPGGVGGNGSIGGGGGGGGWGATGGNGGQASVIPGALGIGGAGGKAINTNGNSITWVAGDTSKIYGAVS